MTWAEIMPGYETTFKAWKSAESFLQWTGILVNCHRRRRVEEVSLANRNGGSLASASGLDDVYFLKKEFSIPWHERFHNAWQGFGWCSTAVREAAALIAAKDAGIGCPEVAAFGESERGAFVLLRGESDMTELRALLPTLSSDAERLRLAKSIGHALAKLHDAGFEHRDLFAKHLLIEPTTFRVCILDWARARRGRVISWRTRLHDLAILEATLHASLASNRLRLRCLRAYLNATQRVPLPLARAASQIQEFAERMRGKRHLREVGQLSTPPGDQQFVPARGGDWLVVRSHFEEFDQEIVEKLMRKWANETPAQARFVAVTCTASGYQWTLHSWPTTSMSWEIPPLAHTLFRLMRFGVPVPRLLAVGGDNSRTFALTRMPAALPFADAITKAAPWQRRRLLEQAGRMVRQIHEAGYQLPAGDTWARRTCVDQRSRDILLADVETLRRVDRAWHDFAPLELGHQRFRLSRFEQLRFLRSYLGKDAVRSGIRSFILKNTNSTERQRAA